MNSIICILMYVLIVPAYGRRFLKAKMKPLCFTGTGLILLALSTLVSQDRQIWWFLMEIYLFLLAWQDYKTLHISRWWVLFSAAFLLIAQVCFPAATRRISGALFFSLPGFLLSRWKGWMGSADPWFLLLFGWILGLERMLICMCITLTLALIYAWKSHSGKLCFLTFLSIGFLVSFLRGYSFYATIFL